MFKKVKAIIFICIVLLVLNRIGWLNDDASKKVDKGYNFVKTKVGDMEYGGKKLSSMTMGEIAKRVGEDVKDVTKDIEITDEGLEVSNGERLHMIINPEKEDVVVAKVDIEDKKAVCAVRKVVKKFTGNEYDIEGLAGDVGIVSIKLKNEGNGQFTLNVN